MSKKVIIVDDSKTSRKLVTMVLGDAGYETIEAVDGLDGMRQLVAHADAALVLCDVNMPNMDGFEMVESARREGIASAHAFVMVTTEADSDLVRRAKACGAKGWIVKPFKPDALLAAVRRLAGEA